MSDIRWLLIVLAVIATWGAAAQPGAAQPAPKVRAAAARTTSERLPMTFFVASAATGHPCGPDCDGWIAAEGRIDLEAPERLRRLLARLGPRKLPLFLNSPGGTVMGAIELGRIIRSRDLTVSVARTLPVACQDGHQDTRQDGHRYGHLDSHLAARLDGQHSKACDTLKRSGQNLVAELDPNKALCNSACVLMLAGGARRSVPPGVRLAVHAIGVDAPTSSISRPVIAAATRVANAHIVDFLHDMGAPRALFDVSNAVPHESSRILGRDDIVRFGIDTREFAEADWRFRSEPFAAITKSFFLHTGAAGIAYPEALLQLNCGAGAALRVVFAQERAAAAEATRPVRLAVDGLRIDVPYLRRVGTLDIHTTLVPPEALAATADNAALEVSSDALVPAGGKPPGRAVALTMTGFSTSYAKLRKACADPVGTCSGPSSQCFRPEVDQDAGAAAQ